MPVKSDVMRDVILTNYYECKIFRRRITCYAMLYNMLYNITHRSL